MTDFKNELSLNGVDVSLEGHTHGAGDIDAGAFDDARIAESNVTQHQAAIDHNALANLATDDVHTQYAHLAGRAGGQQLAGGTGAGEHIVLESTSHGAKGEIRLLDPVRFGLGVWTVSAELPTIPTDNTMTLQILSSTSQRRAYVLQVEFAFQAGGSDARRLIRHESIPCYINGNGDFVVGTVGVVSNSQQNCTLTGPTPGSSPRRLEYQIAFSGGAVNMNHVRVTAAGLSPNWSIAVSVA